MPDEIEDLKRATKQKIDSYIFSLKLYVSAKAFLERSLSTRVFVEKDIDKTIGGKKRPDLFFATTQGHVLIDHKYIMSSDGVTLNAHLDDMRSYQGDYLINDQQVKPEVIMLCPLESAREYSEQGISCPVPILGYLLEREITVEQVVGQIQDTSLRSMFNPRMVFPVSNSAYKYKFIREEPPLPYTAQSVFASLWPLRMDFESPEFKVDYQVVLEQFNTLFPRWLAPDILQMTPGRLNDALHFLNGIGWIRWEGGGDSISVLVSKGGRIPDLLDYLIDEYIGKELTEKKRVSKGRAPRRIKPEIAPSETLEKYFSRGR